MEYFDEVDDNLDQLNQFPIIEDTSLTLAKGFGNVFHVFNLRFNVVIELVLNNGFKVALVDEVELLDFVLDCHHQLADNVMIILNIATTRFPLAHLYCFHYLLSRLHQFSIQVVTISPQTTK